MMSALGAGAVEQGDLVVSLGTSGTVFGTSAAPIMDSTGAIAPFCDATGVLWRAPTEAICVHELKSAAPGCLCLGCPALQDP